MSTKSTQGTPVYVDNLLPITGSEGISVSETPTEITVGVDIPSLTEDVTPSPLDYVVIHGTVDDTKKKLLLAHVESLGNVCAKVDIYAQVGRNQIWTKPAGAKIINVVMFGAGGGGGTGSIRVTSSDRSGGGGGGGGAYFNMFFHADALNDTGYVIVGGPGLAAAATRSNTEIGRSGAAGDGSYFTALKVNDYNVYALGGAGGAGGATIGPLGEAGGAGAGTTDGPPYVNGAGASPRTAAGGGGSGGGFDASSNAAKDGGAGGLPLASTLVAAAGGTGTGGHGANGPDGIIVGGGGGGGGAASNTAGTSGGNGGDGGWPGGGGGGGGAATYDVAYPLTIGGLGGTGADGLVIITTFF